jgi:hypothetical protein
MVALTRALRSIDGVSCSLGNTAARWWPFPVRFPMERTKGLLNARGDHSSLPPPLTPVLFGFPLHGCRIHVLRFEPIGRAAAAVVRVFALRDDALEFQTR